MSYRPEGACDARMLLELGVIGSLSAAQLLDIWDRGISYETALRELSGNAPTPDAEQLAAEQLVMAQTATSSIQ
jgi:hypothetical protein